MLVRANHYNNTTSETICKKQNVHFDSYFRISLNTPCTIYPIEKPPRYFKAVKCFVCFVYYFTGELNKPFTVPVGGRTRIPTLT